MATVKGPSEGGSGGKRGHRNMAHWGFNDEVKEPARSRRRLDDRKLARSQHDDPGWVTLVGERAHEVEKEALLEIGEQHELAGVSLNAISGCPECDAVLFRLPDSSFAVVELTWGGTREDPPLPLTTKLGGFLAVDIVLSQHEH